LKFIIPESPKFNNYYEPFVGGGSVYTAFDANHFYINDKSEELINLYCYIATKNVDFFGWAGAIDQSWKNMLSFSEREIALMDIYFDFRLDKITDQELLTMLRQHLNGERRQFDECLSIQFVWNRDDFFSLLYTTLRRKLLRMKKIEKERVIMPDEDIMDNIETAYMGTLYTYLRSLYNDKHLYVENSPLHTALFLYLRYNSYSGMFRYNDDGDFNVPYGGISYNHKTLEKVLAYYQSEALCRHFENTTMENLDFEEVLS
jgi:DNA adenine methylase